MARDSVTTDAKCVIITKIVKEIKLYFVNFVTSLSMFIVLVYKNFLRKNGLVNFVTSLGKMGKKLIVLCVVAKVVPCWRPISNWILPGFPFTLKIMSKGLLINI